MARTSTITTGAFNPYDSATFPWRQNQGAAPVVTEVPGPDDRYLPGYSTLYPDGSKKYVGPRLKDLNEPYSFYGQFIPISVGTRRLTGVTIWARPYEERTTKKSKKSGKGGGPKSKTTTYEYSASFAVSFGYVNIGNSPDRRDLLRVWADGNLVFDRRTTGTGSYPGIKYRFYKGDDDQLPDPLIEEDFGVGSTPAFRGLMYLVLEDLPLADFGNRRPYIAIEVGDETAQAVTRQNWPGPSKASLNYAIDWDRRLLWALGGDRTSILEYDTEAGAFSHAIQCIGFTYGDQEGAPGTQLSTSCIIALPWMGLLMTCSASLGQQALHLIEPTSGQSLTWFGSDWSSLSGTVGQDAAFEHAYSCANRAYALTGLVETYVLYLNLRNDWIIFRVLAPGELFNDDWMVMPVSSQAQGGTNGWNAACPGESYLGGCTFYAAQGNVIRKLTVAAGAFWLVENGAAPQNNFTTMISPWRDMGSPVLQMKYYEPENVLLVLCSDGNMYKLDAEDGTELGVLAVNPSGNGDAWHLSDASLGNIVVSDSATTVKDIDIASMSINLQADLAAFGGTVGTIIGDGRTRSMFVVQTVGSPLGRTYYDQLSDQRISLASFLEVMAGQSGLQVPDQFEVSADVDDMIDGGLVAERTTLEALLQTLSAVYRFDYPESGGKIQIIRKPQAFAATDFDIPENELAIVDGNGVSLRGRRETEVQLPRRIELSYMTKALDYNYSMQAAQRNAHPAPTSLAIDVLQLRIPIIMQDAEAKTLVYRMLYNGAWSSRVTYRFRLPWKYILQMPSDVGKVTTNGATFQLKLKEIAYNADYSLDVQAEGYLSDQPVSIEADPGMSYEQTIPGPIIPLAVPIDTRLLRTEDDILAPDGATTVMYWTITPYGSAPRWRGGVVEISLDRSNWNEEADNADVPVMGALMADIPHTDWPQQMQFVEVDVRLFGSDLTLQSISYEELNNGGNAAIIGRPETGWEVIQFQDAEHISGKQWRISKLRRGRRGTYPERDAAARAGAYFIMLDADWITAVSKLMALKNQGIFYRTYGYAQPGDLSLFGSFQFKGKSATPLEPVHLRAKEWNAGNLRIDFIRQTRAVGEWGDGQIGEDPPLQELTEEFALWLYADDTYSSPAYVNTTWTFVDGRYRFTVPAATLTDIYGTATPKYVYAGAAQFSAYLDTYGDENRKRLRTP